jgi:hypothetical protein
LANSIDGAKLLKFATLNNIAVTLDNFKVCLSSLEPETYGKLMMSDADIAPERGIKFRHRKSNIQLLKESSWIDIPIIYTDGRHSILAMEKGSSGDRAFADAFATWEKE